MTNSNIFDELNAMLAGGNVETAQNNQRLVQCSDRASLVAPALQRADWGDVVRRREALNQVYAGKRGADTTNGISS